MAVATNNILKLLSELSASADEVLDERASEFKTPRLSEWISIVENKADDIVEGKSSTEESEEVPNLVSYLRGTNIEKGARASTMLTEMQRLHLHQRESRSKSREFIRKSRPRSSISKSPFRRKSIVKVSRQENIAPYIQRLKKTATGYQNGNSSTVTPSYKRKSSSELLLKNVKKPKTNADHLNYQEPPGMKANNSLLLTNNGANIESSVGVANVSVLKENHNLRSKVKAKQEKAVENRKNIMALRQQKLEENKRDRKLKMEKTLPERLKLGKLAKLLRSGQEKNVTPKALQRIHETEELNSAYVTGYEQPSTSYPKDKIVGAPMKGHEKTAKKAVKLLIKKKLARAKTCTSVSKKGSNSYAITSAPSSFVNYDISEMRSDSEDEQETNSKPMPSWATGMKLQIALMQQQNLPIDTDDIFGNVVAVPDLAVIMGVQKRHYNKRTSSAVWNSSFSCS